MKMMSNEQLCILAQQGDTEAQNLLIENNLPYIRRLPMNFGMLMQN